MTEAAAAAWQPSRLLARGNAADQILTDLRDNILSGRLPRGARLPSERQLAESYGVSGPTVREAIRGLTAARLIEVRHGSGAYVTADSNQLIALSLNAMIRMERIGVPELLSVLGALHQLAAELAARHASAQDLAGMRGALTDMEQAQEPEGIVKALVQYLDLLASAGGNPLLAALCRFLAKLQIGLASELAGDSMEIWRRTVGLLSPPRQRIVDAIEARDPAAARAATIAYHEASIKIITAMPKAKSAQVSEPALAGILATLLTRTPWDSA
jgi:GntR family transcriptional repressor for pyruvate dehydrogenase complex